MTTDVIKYEDMTLADLMEPYTKNQQEYLVIRMMGYPVRQARDMIQVTFTTLNNWRVNHPTFKMAEQYLLENKQKYQAELGSMYANFGSVQSLKLMTELVMKGLEKWDKLKPGDKKAALTAAMFLGKLVPLKPNEIRGGSYDEFIIKMSRKTSAVDGEYEEVTNATD